MNRADIRRLGLESEVIDSSGRSTLIGGSSIFFLLERFATLIEAEVCKELEADRQQAIEAAVLAERGGIAQWADAEHDNWAIDARCGGGFESASRSEGMRDFASMIRARTLPAPTGAQKG